LFLVAVLAAAVAVVILAFRHAGSLLVVTDPLQPAQAIVVFGGNVPFRAMEAGRTYHAGWAREVWITQAATTEDDAALDKLGVERVAESELSRRVVERLGVPAAAIRMLPERIVNTADEVKAVAGEAQRVGADRVILITSKYHTRRVRILWRKFVGDSPAALVRYTSDDPFDPDHWWRTTSDAMRVPREWFGLLNALLGSPVKSAR
jgi:uncharacterized SAM-binding protein YcdF (DUF218 family)